MNIEKDLKLRQEWIRQVVKDAHSDGAIYGNSGGKDCTLVSALIKSAGVKCLGVIMPCNSVVNYNQDLVDAVEAGKYFDIPQITVDLSKVKDTFMEALGENLEKDAKSDWALHSSKININPRLRMTTLYALGQARNLLVAGTGNLDERTMGYFTKWGDGGFDFDPIADLNVSEVYEYLEYFGAPRSIIDKAPSAGLFPGQTDEGELGIKYSEIDKYVRGIEISDEDKLIIEKAKARSAHKLKLPKVTDFIK